MSNGVKRLTELVKELESSGGDESRLHPARCALNFKRSWVELGAALTEVRKSGAFRGWGYEDLPTYCATELGMRRATADKLLVSYATLRKHAPDRLAEPSSEVPSYQALDYLARVTSEPRGNGDAPRNAPEKAPSKKVLDALHTAVFDEGCSVRALREQFDPLVRPRTADQKQEVVLRKLSATARKLLEHLTEAEDLETKPVKGLRDVIKGLRSQTEALSQELKDLTKTKAKAKAKAA
jgi:hypothetical protein